MIIPRRVFDNELREKDLKKKKDDVERREEEKISKKNEREAINIPKYTWDDQLNQCFFYHYEIEEKKYQEAKGKMKRYVMFENMEKNIKKTCLKRSSEIK